MKPKLQENKALFDSDANLWNSCDAVNLKTNFRVGDSPWNETLSRIRLGEENEARGRMLYDHRSQTLIMGNKRATDLKENRTGC